MPKFPANWITQLSACLAAEGLRGGPAARGFINQTKLIQTWRGYTPSRTELVEMIADLSNHNPFPEAEDIADGLIEQGWIDAT